MKRRKFVASSAVVATAATSASAMDAVLESTARDNEYYELRHYEMSFGGNRKSLMTYLSDVLLPTLKDAGASHTVMFKEQGDAEPSKLWVMISYPDLDTYDRAVKAQSSAAFIDRSSDHAVAGKAYNRYTSSLLKAFDGLPQMLAPGDDKTLFELRIYEGENEDAVRRKVMMFDKEEIALFEKVGLNSVFFGKMIIGPYMPSLVYMLGFRDMEDRSQAWGKFVAHPDWNRMKVLPQYANTVSNIRKIFLEKV